MLSPQEIIDREHQLRVARSEVEEEWRLIEKHQVIKRSELSRMAKGGDNRSIYDNTASVARKNLAAALYGQMANPSSRWFELGTPDTDLDKWQPVRHWFHLATSIVHLSLGPTISRFYSEAPMFFEQLTLRGQSLIFSRIAPEEGRFHDQSLSLWNTCVVYDEFGRMIGAYRRMMLTKARALSLFGDATPAKVRDEKSANREFRFIHAIFQNDEFNPRKLGDKRFHSVYVFEEQPQYVSRSGYEEMPLFGPRWDTLEDSDYGFGPGLDALISQVQLNGYDRANAILAARQAKPPLAAPNASFGDTIRQEPGTVSYGAVDKRGQQLVREIYQTSQPGLNLEMADQKRAAVKDAYYYSLMQLVGRSGMSATEVLELSQERARLFAPHTGRVQAEGLTPFIMYRFRRLFEQGQIPDPPAELAGRPMNILYTSPFAKAQQMAEADATIRYAQGLGMLEQLAPGKGAMDNIDMDRAAAILQTGFGAPPDIMPSEAVREATRQARQQQEQAAQLAQLADTGGRGLAAISQAAATAREGQMQEAA